MKSTEYSALVDEFTDQWRKSPSEFQKGIDRFALLGIFMLVIAFLVAVALIAILHVWTVIAGLVILYSIGRAIFYKPEGVAGVAIRREDAPLLFDDVDQITSKLGARKCDGIRLDFEFNAAAIQYHRWGIVGPIKNYVLLGVPLMDAMGREHVRSTIAHEVGHLMLKHGSRARRWYAMSEMYLSMREHLRGGLVWYLFGPFANWFLPRFHARLQPVSLRSEFEADAKEVSVTSPTIAAEALCYLTIGSNKSDIATREYCARAAESGSHSAADLAESVYAALRSWTSEEAEDSLTNALQAATDIEGTHPALAERIAAIGAEPAIPEPVPTCASDEYFGSKRSDIAAAAAHFFIEASPYYEGLSQAFVECSNSERKLAERVANGQATQEEVEEFVHATGFLHGSAKARPYIESHLQKYPSSSALHYFHGITLLKADDEEGIDALKRAAHLQSESVTSIYETIYQYFLSRGRTQEAAEFRRRRDEFSDSLHETYKLRLRIDKDQDYEPAGFPKEELESIQQILQQSKGVGSAYLAKRRASDAPVPMYDIAIFPRKRLIVVDAEELRSEVETAVSGFGRAITVFYGPWLNADVRRRLMAVQGALIFDRSLSEP